MPLGTPTPEHGARDAKTVVNVWQLGRHAEGVRQIANFHRLAKGQTVANAVHQISDNRLAGDKGGVRLGIPRPDNQLPGRHQRLRAWPVFRFHGKIIFQHRRLAVENVVFILCVLLKTGKDLFHIIDQKNT